MKRACVSAIFRLLGVRMGSEREDERRVTLADTIHTRRDSETRSRIRRRTACTFLIHKHNSLLKCNSEVITLLEANKSIQTHCPTIACNISSSHSSFCYDFYDFFRHLRNLNASCGHFMTFYADIKQASKFYSHSNH